MVRIDWQRGDTLTEVMFATAIASLVIIMGISVMNRGLAQTQLAVETTFARQAIDSQAEILRYARDEYKKNPGAGAGGAKVWRDIIAQTKPNASAFGTCDFSIPNQFFVSDNDLSNLSVNTNPQPANIFPVIGEGLWVEAIAGNNAGLGSIKYIDFHIRACWEPPFQGPNSTLGTIVRLYYE